MSVVRGRPPGLAGGINGASRAYCSSLRACPAPKSPTRARLCVVHMACLQQGLLPSCTAGAAAPPRADRTARASQTASYGRVIVLAGAQSRTYTRRDGCGWLKREWRVMLTRKRVIAAAVGVLALSAAAAGSAWAVVNPQDDYYQNDNSFGK